ncbi:hypothetical protein Pcinc_006731 [Petrolisthes cinctipes]|uniref:UBZ1-type domain-containing protein n=1 Tax=Petrolisthes cinctipes TaxID=88211 RepID=A0AAE1GAK7_PETCI|nr:hypothetical protein Pcinc_006731 [Petrolisthes cinctipes]
MAELVVEGASLVGSRETNTPDQPLTSCQGNLSHHTLPQETPTTTSNTTSTSTSTPSTRQEPRKNTVSRVLPGGVSVLDRSSPLSSPANSPRTPDSSHNYNIDASGSTYALQVALRNMKERYHKLQKKMALIEDDNSRLITGKSELFGEIGKLQENSIKLREKNLQLNHEIHSKHQECCSLKERFSAMSTENMSLARQLARSAHDNRKLTKQVTSLSEENTRLREKMDQIATQVRALPGGGGGGLADISQLTSHRTKIIPDTDDLDSFEDLTTRFHSSLDDYDQVGNSTDTLASDWCIGEDGEEVEVASSIQTATRRMRRLLSGLQEQHHSLLLLSPLLHTLSLSSHHNTHNDSEPGESTLGQQDRALSTLTLTPSSGHNTREDLDGEDEDGTCQSRLATCGSVINSNLTSAGGMIVGPLTDDSGGDSNNVNIGGSVLEERPTSPFDWRQVQMSDDEGGGREGGSGGSGDLIRPDTRTVSTSPDPSLGGVGRGVAGQEEEDRICPMCNAVFPMIVPQESFESHVVSHFEVENGFEVIS